MVSLDDDSLFTNIPLDETIDICIDRLYINNENTPEIPKDIFRNLLNVATKEFFLCLIINAMKKNWCDYGNSIATSSC